MGFTKGPFVRKLGAFVVLSDADMAVLADFHRRRRAVPAGKQLAYEGQKGQSAYIVLSGWAFSYKLLPGGNRQIIDFHIPGDFLGLRAALFPEFDQNIDCLTDVEVCEVGAADIASLSERSATLAMALLWAAARDQAMMAEHLVDLGRRTAAERTAHFLLELAARLALVGIGDADGFECPLSQYLLADALGLSAVHVNRVLRDLREDGMLTFQKGVVKFDDRAALGALAHFDPRYLEPKFAAPA